MAYTPPENPDFIFTETDYSAPVDGLDMDFLFQQSVPAGTFYILAGTSVDFTSIWAEPNANLTTARFQVGTRGAGAALSIINIPTNTVYDYYTTTVSGRAGEALDSNATLDLVTA